MTLDEALAHPTWSMGPKITVDSATLANKGLELIEAHFLFGVPYDRIEVVVHPTSVVHALVRFRDGAALAHLGYPDMRVPISYALTYPGARRHAGAAPSTSRPGSRSSSTRPTPTRSRCSRLAREAGERAAARIPCAFNAANEVAVAAFLDGRIGFLEHRRRSSRSTLDAVDGAPASRPRRADRGDATPDGPPDWPRACAGERAQLSPELRSPSSGSRSSCSSTRRALLRVAGGGDAAAEVLRRLPARDR